MTEPSFRELTPAELADTDGGIFVIDDLAAIAIGVAVVSVGFALYTVYKHVTG